MTADPAVVQARRAHSARCRQRVIKALDAAVASGQEITVSSIARQAGVDRSFLYRHRDLHAQVITRAAEPPAMPGGGPAVSRASLIADLAAAHERAARLAQHNRQLQQRLSELLGEQAWRESGLGAPPDIRAVQQQVTTLGQRNAELRGQLSDRGDELEAARAANRELIAQVNRRGNSRSRDQAAVNASRTEGNRMPGVTLTIEDADELADLLRFLGEWLTADHDQLGDFLARFTGEHPYSIDMLLHDLGRFRLLLGGDYAEGDFLQAGRPPLAGQAAARRLTPREEKQRPAPRCPARTSTQEAF